jgi:hypothetical protein
MVKALWLQDDDAGRRDDVLGVRAMPVREGQHSEHLVASATWLPSTPMLSYASRSRTASDKPYTRPGLPVESPTTWTAVAAVRAQFIMVMGLTYRLPVQSMLLSRNRFTRPFDGQTLLTTIRVNGVVRCEQNWARGVHGCAGPEHRPDARTPPG